MSKIKLKITILLTDFVAAAGGGELKMSSVVTQWRVWHALLPPLPL